MMQSGKSYTKDSAHFLGKIKTLGCMPDNTIPVTADVVGLYSSIPHQASLIALKTSLTRDFWKRYLLRAWTR